MKLTSIHYSEYFNVPHEDFTNRGVYDGFINQDSVLHVNPFLLKKCNEPEFQNGYESFLDYFKPILLLARNATTNGRYYQEIQKRLEFKEVANTGLGFSKGMLGTGISGKISEQLTQTSIEVIKEGLQDPNFFAILPFIEDGIGADRISDMTIRILLNQFRVYTQRISLDLNLPTKIFKDIEGNTYQLPVNKYNNKNLIFIPECLLCDMPLARSYDDINSVCDYNDKLRRKVAEVIGLSWKEFNSLHKRELKQYILRNHSLLQMIIDDFKSLDVLPYDFRQDLLGEYIDKERIKKDVETHPLVLPHEFDKDNVMEVTLAICKQFKKLIEDNRMYNLLYNDDGKARKETATQLVFYVVADSYCRANNIDLNRECDSGCGELDFKLSKGYNEKVLIEIKLSSNPQLAHGLTKQLPAYQAAEGTPHGILLIIKLDNADDKKIERVLKLRKNIQEQYIKAPEVIVVDATIKPSASKL